MKTHNVTCGICAVVLCLGAIPALRSRAATVTINPSKDNTLFESSSSELSDGAGGTMYAGKTGFNDGFLRRRAVMAFDIAGSLPANASITGASLQLHVSKVSPTFA